MTTPTAAPTTPTTMLATVQDRYGSSDVLVTRELPVPAPVAGEILIEVRACGLNAADWHLMRGDPCLVRAVYGLRRPRQPILGSDVAGVVAAVGSGVTAFAPGDEVVAEVDRGGLAGFVAIKQEYAGPRPATLTWEQAGTLPMAGLTALQGLRDAGRLTAGQRVVVNGASGGVGHFAVQIARAMGAEVTAVTSGRNADLVRSLGAAEVIDYTATDVTQGAGGFDVVIDTIGTHALRAWRRVMAPRGRYVAVGALGGGRLLGPMPRLVRTPLSSRPGRQAFVMLSARRRNEDLRALHDLVADGALTPVLAGVYSLDRAPEALRRLEAGHVAGKLAITMATG